MTNKQKAIWYMLASTFSFSVMQIIVKLTSKNIPVFQQVFVRNLFTAFFGLFLIIKNKDLLFGKKENQGALLTRSVLGYLGVLGYFIATRYLNAADVAILHRSSPFFVTIFSALFLKRKLMKFQVVSLLLASFGAALVVKPQFDFTIVPALIALGSAAAAGGAYTTINYLKGKEKNSTIIFHFSIFSCVVSILIGGRTFVMPNFQELIWLSLIGIFAAFGQIFLTIAYKMTDPGQVSIFNYSGVVFAGLLGVIFFGEVIDFVSLIGICIVITAATIIYVKREQ